MKRIELETWSRKQLFEFYKGADLPYIILSARVDVTRLLHRVRRGGFSFAAALAFCCTRTANSIKNFRYRFDEEGPYSIERNAAMLTHIREGEDTFVTLEGPATDDMATFCRAISAQAETPGYDYGIWNLAGRPDIINYSSVPWVDYTHVFRTIARAGQDCVPKISWGKFATGGAGITSLTLSVQVHHGLMDGYHVGLFFERLQEYLDSL